MARSAASGRRLAWLLYWPNSATPAAALDALAADDVLQQGLAPAISHALQTVKRQEPARHEQAADKALWLRREYFSRC